MADLVLKDDALAVRREDWLTFPSLRAGKPS
jgi:hypothetical protein